MPVHLFIYSGYFYSASSTLWSHPKCSKLPSLCSTEQGLLHGPVARTSSPPPWSNMPFQWLAPQFGMASRCCSAHSLEPFLGHSSLNLSWFYLVVLGLGGLLKWRSMFHQDRGGKTLCYVNLEVVLYKFLQ